MKKQTILFLLLLSGIPATAQKPAAPLTQPNIQVTGMAEMEIIPDEVYVNVSIREFTRDKKKNTIEDLEGAFLNFVEKTIATPRTDVTMEYTDARINALKRRTKDPLIQKVYEVKFKSYDQYLLLATVADSLYLNNVYIKKYSHSKIEDYKKQVRIAAMINAKEKAGYMLQAVNQKTGALLLVEEPTRDVLVFDGLNDYSERKKESSLLGPRYYSDTRVFDDDNDFAYNAGPSISPIQKKIKLRFYVDVTYAIA
ncbi:MAG TPA: SIMPL domain-containing protein [Bacteroidia bacterium]|nr:SIMPL domain-containing protein [Bacteroidia bacterium]